MKTMTPIRLALREEGPWWNAYLAPTEVDPLRERWFHIASIRMSIVRRHDELREKFVAYCTAIMTMLIEEIGIEVLSTEEKPVPPGERGGHA